MFLTFWASWLDGLDGWAGGGRERHLFQHPDNNYRKKDDTGGQWMLVCIRGRWKIEDVTVVILNLSTVLVSTECWS